MNFSIEPFLTDIQLPPHDLEEYQHSRIGASVGPSHQSTASMERWRRLNYIGSGLPPPPPPPPPPKPPSVHRASLPTTITSEQLDGKYGAKTNLPEKNRLHITFHVYLLLRLQ